MSAAAAKVSPALALVPSALPDATALEWFTPAELAAMQLPGLPGSKRRINIMAAERGWADTRDASGRRLARRSAERGGGWEYHRSLLPPQSLLALSRRGEPTTLGGTPTPRRPDAAPTTPSWTRFDALSEASKNEARRRLEILVAVEALETAGLTATAAIASIAGQREVAPATLWNWRKLIAGLAASDRLPALAPARKGGGAEAEIDPRAWSAFSADYLRPEKPTLAACYGRLERMAAAQGWRALPHAKTFQRRLARELDPRAVVLAREGADALRRILPPQQRSIAELHALEHVNIDGHKWDVFVRWPDGRIGRPMMVAIQDLYSRKMLSWRIVESENAVDVRLCFADLFKRYGVPQACTLDNGRAFASKWITGGAPSRYRFKVKDTDPLGLLTQFGVEIHWALPYRGQSKPIERAFRTLEGRIGTHPAFAGAYVGNSPDAKPDNYGARAIPIDEFRAVVDAEIAVENARGGRDTEMGRGLYSYDQVFETSYTVSPIRRATPEQFRLALLAADEVSADRKSGAITLYGNHYWSEEQLRLAGQRVVARFDPDDLQTEVHLYDLAGRFLLTSPIWRAVGFSDAGAAQARARLESDHKRKAKAALAAEVRLSTAELASMLPRPVEPECPSPRVIRAVRGRGHAAAALLQTTESDADAGHPPTEGRSPAPTPAIDRFLVGMGRLRLVE